MDDGVIGGIAVSGIHLGHPHPGDKLAGSAIVGFYLKVQIAGRCSVTGRAIEPPEINVPTAGMLDVAVRSGLQPGAGEIDQHRKIRQIPA